MDIEQAIINLQQQVAALEAEAAARRVLGRYMFLCDSPNPAGEMSAESRGTAIAELFTEDGVWEGIGGAHGALFGRNEGRAAIADHMAQFYGAQDPRQIFNTHYVCSEQVLASPNGVEGQWVQFQPWINDRGEALLRSSRLNVRFRETSDGWKIACYRTENIFIADLPSNWPTALISESILMSAASR